MNYGCLQGIGFNNLDPKGKTERDFVPSAPDWRVAVDGLNLEGLCNNKNCEAYKKWVIINIGFGIFDLILNEKPTNCPICKKPVFPETCAFSTCSYRYSGIKIIPGKGPSKMQ